MKKIKEIFNKIACWAAPVTSVLFLLVLICSRKKSFGKTEEEIKESEEAYKEAKAEAEAQEVAHKKVHDEACETQQELKDLHDARKENLSDLISE